MKNQIPVLKNRDGFVYVLDETKLSGRELKALTFPGYMCLARNIGGETLNHAGRRQEKSLLKVIRSREVGVVHLSTFTDLSLKLLDNVCGGPNILEILRRVATSASPNDEESTKHLNDFNEIRPMLESYFANMQSVDCEYRYAYEQMNPSDVSKFISDASPIALQLVSAVDDVLYVERETKFDSLVAQISAVKSLTS